MDPGGLGFAFGNGTNDNGMSKSNQITVETLSSSHLCGVTILYHCHVINGGAGRYQG